MESMPYLVDWNEVVKRHADGTLHAVFWQALEDGEPWIEPLDWVLESNIHYTYVAEAYEELREELPDGLRAKADEFMLRLITFEGYCNDLGELDEFALNINPESAARFAELGAGIDFTAFRDAFHAACPDDVKTVLADYSESGDPNRSFEDGFLPYVEMWIDTMKKAAESGRGVLIQWG